MKLIKKFTLFTLVMTSLSIISCAANSSDDSSNTTPQVPNSTTTQKLSNEVLKSILFENSNWVSSENSYWKIDISKKFTFYTEDEYNKIAKEYNATKAETMMDYSYNPPKEMKIEYPIEKSTEDNLKIHGFYKIENDDFGATNWFYKYEKKSSNEIVLSYRNPGYTSNFSIVLTPDRNNNNNNNNNNNSGSISDDFSITNGNWTYTAQNNVIKYLTFDGNGNFTIITKNSAGVQTDSNSGHYTLNGATLHMDFTKSGAGSSFSTSDDFRISGDMNSIKIELNGTSSTTIAGGQDTTESSWGIQAMFGQVGKSIELIHKN